MGEVQDLIDRAEQAVAYLRAEVEDAKRKGLEALVALGAEAQTRLDAMDAGAEDGEEVDAEAVAEEVDAEE